MEGSLERFSHGRDNNLSLLRMIAALAVVYTHAFGLTHKSGSEPFKTLLGFGPGDLAVDVFFVISGFLVTKSASNKHLIDFVWARCMRIFPGLWVSGLFLVAVSGIAFSPLHATEFWLRPETLTYLLKNGTMIPGVGAQTDLPMAIDGRDASFNISLWTISHELQMYAVLAVLLRFGMLRKPWSLVFLMGVGLVTYSADLAGIFHLMGRDRSRFIYLFFAGASFYALRGMIRLNGAAAAACLMGAFLPVFLHAEHVAKRLMVDAAIPYLVLWLAFIPSGPLRLYNRVGDYSYGTYIYAFPVQAVLVQKFSVMSPVANFVLTLMAVLPVAVASWHLVESKALALPVPLKSIFLRCANVRKR